MPELPEVETIRLGLAEHALGRKITRVTGSGRRLVRNNPHGMQDLLEFLPGQQIRELERRGKYLWLVFADADHCLLVHLGMSGQVLWNRAESEVNRHERVRLYLDDGSALCFNDQRMFGALTISELVEGTGGRLVPAAATHIAADPLEPAFDVQAVAKRLRRSTRHLKTLLLDQQVVSGIGNIYADEALHRSRVHGLRRAEKLPLTMLVDTLTEAEAVMRESIAQGGTSFDELYVDTAGNPGYFARSLRVYGREGEPCETCGTPIQKVQVDGRSHHYCPQCQPRPRGK